MSRYPDTIAATPRVEEPMAISSTERPCFLKIPASWAAQSGRNAPAGAGYATRSGRSAACDSAPLTMNKKIARIETLAVLNCVLIVRFPPVI
jgi:hypothetical protein